MSSIIYLWFLYKKDRNDTSPCGLDGKTRGRRFFLTLSILFRMQFLDQRAMRKFKISQADIDHVKRSAVGPHIINRVDIQCVYIFMRVNIIIIITIKWLHRRGHHEFVVGRRGVVSNNYFRAVPCALTVKRNGSRGNPLECPKSRGWSVPFIVM